MPAPVDPEWYRKIWTMDIEDMSWVEDTAREVDFAVQVLDLRGHDRVLDLACGFGRHALELARRGHPVVGVDITQEYIDEARRRARADGLDAEFICADLRDVSFHEEFDVVLSLADGAIGYFESDDENLKTFDRIAGALKPGGKHLMGVCNAPYARRHFQQRHWEAGSRGFSLADFAWDGELSRMTYTSYKLKYGEVLGKPEGAVASIRLYTVDELSAVLTAHGMEIKATYGDYDSAVPASTDRLTLLVHSEKGGSR